MRLTKATEADTGSAPLRELTPSQMAAVQLLAQGLSDAKTAKVVKVSRQSVNTWRHSNKQFKQALEEAREAIWSESRLRLRALTGKAMDTLEEAIDEGSIPAALGLLRAVITWERGEDPPPPGKTIIEVRYGEPDREKEELQ